MNKQIRTTIQNILKSLLGLMFLSGLLMPVMAQVTAIQNSEKRCTLSLNGKWNYIVDPYEVGYYDYRNKPYDENPKPQDRAFFTNTRPKDKTERIEYDFDRSPTLSVPGDWNSQEEKLLYYEGTVWYKKSFNYSRPLQGNRVFLCFGGVNYRADVYVNGKKAGMHKGGFTPFSFDISGLLVQGDNFVVVKVSNTRRVEEVPTLNTDWWNYGGITRDVFLSETPSTFIRDYKVQLRKGSGEVLAGYVQLDGPDAAGREGILEIPALRVSKRFNTDANGKAVFEIPSGRARYWSPEDPFLYDVSIGIEGDRITDRIGFRNIEVRGTDILLNGKPVFLKGISIHEENAPRGGRAWSREDAVMLLTWARELGCNFVRLAHYPHNENMARVADEMGIMVWEENPVYWAIQWSNPETFRTAVGQLKELIYRDKNRASVVVWSMANETPVTPERMDFLKNLADTARMLDDARLISAALEQHGLPGNELVRTIEDPFIDYVDLVSFNEYIGWYDGLPDKCARIEWRINTDKPVFISEFGADALGGLHGDSLTRWSEEYQDYLYRETLGMIKKIPQLRGCSPWILVDFRSPRRVLPGIQDGWNRKGLISGAGVRKKAFYTLRDFYEKSILAH